MTEYKFLQPFTFKNGVTVKNRVVIPPMTDTMAFRDGTVTDDEVRYYQLHSGGVGMFVTAVANVNPLGKGFEGEMSVESDDMIPGLTRVARAIQHNGTKAILQIFSAGRMSNSKILRGEQTVSASAVAAPRPGMETPRALSAEEVTQTIQDFGEATRRAIQAGFDGVEIHGANTYLIQQFFSPHSNRRTDQWGGTLEKRMAFPLAVVKAVHQAVEQYAKRPFIVGYRLSPEEIEKPGIRLSDTLALVEALKAQPIDYLHVSLNHAWRTQINNTTDDDRPDIEQIQSVAGDLPLVIVGGLRKPDDLEEVLDKGFTFAAIGHASLMEPNWVEKVQAGHADQLRTQFNAEDLSELAIPRPFWRFIQYVSGDRKDY